LVVADVKSIADDVAIISNEKLVMVTAEGPVFCSLTSRVLPVEPAVAETDCAEIIRPPCAGAETNVAAARQTAATTGLQSRGRQSVKVERGFI
jgi:hypothetical protein